MIEGGIIQCISQSIKIIDLADEFGISLEETSGKFDYRCRCPFHSNGRENTPSLYISSEQNSFFCFGCSKGSNPIDFYILVNQVTFTEALQELRSRLNNPQSLIPAPKKENNFGLLLSFSSFFRENLIQHPEKREWILSMMKQADTYIDQIPAENIASTKKLISKIKKSFKSKVGELCES